MVVDGDSAMVDGWLVSSCAWWEGPETLKLLEDGLARAAAQRTGPWLWAYHGPPEGPLAWTGSKHFGDPELPRLIDEHRPDIVLCGHIHQAPFVDGGGWAEQRGDHLAVQQRPPARARSRAHVFLDLDGRTRGRGGRSRASGEVSLGAARRPRCRLSSRATDPSPGSISTGGREARRPSTASIMVRCPSASAYWARTSPRYASSRCSRPASWRASSRPISGCEAKNASGSPMIRTVDGDGRGDVGRARRAEQRGDLADEPAGHRDVRQVGAVEVHPQRAVHEHGHRAGVAVALAEQHLAGLEPPLRHAGRDDEDVAAGRSPARATARRAATASRPDGPR